MPPGHDRINEVADELLTHGATYPLMPPDDIPRMAAVSPDPGLSVHVLGADLTRQRPRIVDVAADRGEEGEGLSMTH